MFQNVSALFGNFWVCSSASKKFSSFSLCTILQFNLPRFGHGDGQIDPTLQRGNFRKLYELCAQSPNNIFFTRNNLKNNRYPKKRYGRGDRNALQL